MSLNLILDTSSERGIVAIAENTQVFAKKELSFGYGASRELMPEIQALLQGKGLKASDLSYIAVGVGPGSYTGLRIAAAAAKGIAFACKLPLIAIGSLEGLIPQSDGSFASLMDARSGGAYLQKGIRQNGAITERGPAQLLPWDAALAELETCTHIITANSQPLKKRFGDAAERWQWQERAPDAEHLAALAYTHYQSGDYTRDASLELQYLRRTQAELELSQP